MYPVLQIAGLSIQTAGLAIIVAGWLGMTLAAREARRLGIGENVLWDAGFYALIGGLISARLWYVATYWSAYREDLRQVLALNPGTMAWGPGIFIGLLIGLIYLQRKGIPLARAADALAFGVPPALAILRVGDHLTGRVLGAPTQVPGGVAIWDTVRHPVALYEALAALLVWAALWRLRDRQRHDGALFWWTLFLLAVARLILEAYRADSALTAGGIRIAQVIALLVALGALHILSRQHTRTESPMDGGAREAQPDAAPQAPSP